MLRKIRLTVAIFFFVLITLLFLDFTGTLHGWFDWMAKIQFLPALLALNVGVVIALIVLTLLLGRVYCSVSFRTWFHGWAKSGRRTATLIRLHSIGCAMEYWACLYWL